MVVAADIGKKVRYLPLTEGEERFQYYKKYPWVGTLSSVFEKAVRFVDDKGNSLITHHQNLEVING